MKSHENEPPPSSIRSLGDIKRPNGEGVNASAGQKYDKLFGRDSLRIAGDLIKHYPQIAREVIMTLAERQGEEENPKSEESIGKILHEEMKNKLARKNKLASFVSGDSTPLFVELICDYADSYGEDILSETVEKPSGQIETIETSLISALNWITDNINDEGLVEIDRRSVLENFFGQSWKDSLTAYIHPDGELVNIRGGIIFPEIQALSYDALSKASNLFESKDPDFSESLRLNAEKMKNAIFDKLWNEDDEYFASCLEQNSSKSFDQVNTFESTSGRLLNSGIFDEMDEDQKSEYIKPIVERLFSKDFLTDAGVRTRSFEHADKLKFADYHGSYTTWPVETYAFARGLRRQGLPKLAEELENRITNTVNLAGIHYEFFIAKDDGSVLVEYDPKNTGTDGKLDVQFVPEHDQGWTISAIQDIKRNRTDRFKAKEQISQNQWQKDLEESILSNIEKTEPLKYLSDIEESRPDKQDVKLRVIPGLAKTAAYLLKEFPKQALERAIKSDNPDKK